jgi:branched-chain amino acid transport system permease protein
MMHRLATPAALLAVALGYFVPQIAGGSSVVYAACTMIAIFAVMSYGTDLILSYLGEVSLGHTIFWAAGGYAAAMLSVKLEWNGWATALAAVAVALVLASVLGLVTLRTREFVFSLVTYAAAVVAMEIAFNWSFLGGSDGIVGVPPLDLSIGPLRLVAGNDAELWPYAFALLIAVLYLVARFRRSRLGTLAMMANLNPRLATTSGVDVGRVRLAVLVLSAPVTGSAGWLYAYQRAYVGPDLFETYFLVFMLTAVVIVGRRLLFGPLLGAALILGQERFLSFGGDVDAIVLGGTLITVLAFFPGGLVGLRRSVTERRSARHG